MGAMKRLAVARAMNPHPSRLHQRTPDCPYCNQPLDGPTINGLHANCNQALQEELAELEKDYPLLIAE